MVKKCQLMGSRHLESPVRSIISLKRVMASVRRKGSPSFSEIALQTLLKEVEKKIRVFFFLNFHPRQQTVAKTCLGINFISQSSSLWEQTWIPFTQGYFVPSLVAFGPVALEKMKMWKVYWRTDRQTTDDMRSGKRTWAFSSVELKTSAHIY